jgi:hypothetical protein
MSAGRRQTTSKSEPNGNGGSPAASAEPGQDGREQNAAPEADIALPPASQSM